MVAFEIARRRRFAADLDSVPAGTTVHVVPTGAPEGRYNDVAKLKYADFRDARVQIDSARRATIVYLDSSNIATGL